MQIDHADDDRLDTAGEADAEGLVEQYVRAASERPVAAHAERPRAAVVALGQIARRPPAACTTPLKDAV